jgi:hypothetical protein
MSDRIPEFYPATERRAVKIRIFRGSHKCDLSPSACASRFTKAQAMTEGGAGLPLYQCKSCQIGACHAGRAVSIKKRRECLRCRCWASKLVSGLLCVSCYNRQQEVLKGRDRRGRPPHVTCRFWDHAGKRRGEIPAVFRIMVAIEGHGVQTYPATRPREALGMASRQFLTGQPLKLAVVNANELGSQIPRTRAA